MSVRRPVAVDPLTEAYRFLQRVVGVIALLLPPVVYLGDLIIDGHGLRGSISSYYYGRTGGWFVGSLCALGVFFLSYDYRKRPGHTSDNGLSNVAAAMSIGVALFPTSSDGAKATGGSQWVALVHLVCAGVLFASLAVFSFLHFTRWELTDDASNAVQDEWGWRRIYRDPPSLQVPAGSRKPLRNTIHRVCGVFIVLGILGVVVNNILDGDLMFFGEALAVWAFGCSWIVKSHWLSAIEDEPEAPAAE